MYSGMSLEDVMATDVTPGVTAQAIRDYWPIERELLATLVEIVHALLLTTQKAHGAKGVGKVIQIPRPTFGVQEDDEMLAAGAFTRGVISGEY